MDEEKIIGIIRKAKGDIAKIANRLRNAKAKADKDNLYLQYYIEDIIERLEPKSIFMSED